MAPPLSNSTPKKSSPFLLHTKTHSAHPSSVTHTAHNSPSPHTSPPSLLKPLPPSPSSLHAAHGGTHAHATGDATAMSCSRLLSASPQFTHTISTINSITITNTTTTTIKSADQPIHHLLPRHQRHRLHPMQPTRHPLLSFTPVSTSNPLHADCAASAIARSILVTATPNFNYPPSTLKTIGPTNTTTTTTSSTTSIGTLYSTSKAARPSLHHQNYLYQQPQMP
nr:hypothetical transcript [Hymenolepis microstoma]